MAHLVLQESVSASLKGTVGLGRATPCELPLQLRSSGPTLQSAQVATRGCHKSSGSGRRRRLHATENVMGLSEPREERNTDVASACGRVIVGEGRREPWHGASGVKERGSWRGRK